MPCQGHLRCFSIYQHCTNGVISGRKPFRRRHEISTGRSVPRIHRQPGVLSCAVERSCARRCGMHGTGGNSGCDPRRASRPSEEPLTAGTGKPGQSQYLNDRDCPCFPRCFPFPLCCSAGAPAPLHRGGRSRAQTCAGTFLEFPSHSAQLTHRHQFRLGRLSGAPRSIAETSCFVAVKLVTSDSVVTAKLTTAERAHARPEVPPHYREIGPCGAWNKSARRPR